MRDTTTLVRRIEDPDDRARTHADLVVAVAGFDPAETEALAEGLPDPTYRNRDQLGPDFTVRAT